LDTLSNQWNKVITSVRKDFFECTWYKVYELLEFAADAYPFQDKKAFIESCNKLLEREISAYRFVNGLLTRITDEQEVAEIELALEKAQGPVRTHLQRALELLADKKSPDYRNSIKESISAIESLTATIVGKKGNLGQLIKKLEDEIGLHPALGKAFSNLYGYTSDKDGIRHAILESDKVFFEDAKFFLVTCSAFANFVEVKVATEG